MKKIITVITFFIALLSLSSNASAKKPIDGCDYVTDGSIPYASGHNLNGQFLMPGYDAFGYNYQAHIFNGSFANAYLGRPGSAFPPYMDDDASYLVDNPTAVGHWTWPFRNVDLQMKWNDAWLANKDCNSDNALDRSSPYIGSGAWLTNHAKGTYEGSAWDVAGGYVLTFDYLGSLYVHDTTIDSSFTGTGGYPSGLPYSITWTVTGTVTGDNVSFRIDYDGSGYYVDAVGTIASDGTMSGTWSNASQAGTWTTTSGNVNKQICEVSDFVKIIAPPNDANLEGGIWYTAESEEIGPVIWGSFAIIQEIASDPCEEYGVINYLSPLKAGLGNWED